MSFNKLYLPKSDVVFSVMFLDKELCEKTLNIILGENIELINIVNEFKNDLYKAALNSIYFDVRTKTKDGRIITLDIQRQYIKNRIRNRTVYYACREVGSQKVVQSKYEDLKNVVITFILTEATLKWTRDNRKITLQDTQTNEKYSDLLTIHEVNIRHINDKNNKDMIILRDFFQIDAQLTYDKFVSNYENTSFGRLLLKSYKKAVEDTSLLENLVKEEKFMFKLTEAAREAERQEGIKEGKLENKIETAKVAFEIGLNIEQIKKLTGLSEEEISNLK